MRKESKAVTATMTTKAQWNAEVNSKGGKSEQGTIRQTEDNAQTSNHVSLLVIPSNVNGLNTPIKKHRVAEWVMKEDPHCMLSARDVFTLSDTYRLKVKG